ncbi:MAG: hypothetical protein JXR25_17400 [Pontiellaceae bacterium]|nr:hypothetical protein [Pontiellaceae bacterium]MBN2786597.1 hypothetical protein [Pontiellaceae bacterium]
MLLFVLAMKHIGNRRISRHFNVEAGPRIGRRILPFVAAAVLLGATPVYASGRITAIDVRESEIEFQVETTEGQNYQLQCCGVLRDESWSNIGTEFTAETNLSTLVATPESVGCYFRVIKVESNSTTSEPTPPGDEPSDPPDPPSSSGPTPPGNEPSDPPGPPPAL